MYPYPSGNCGCAQTGMSFPILPVNGALIADDRYLSLDGSSSLRLLGVQLGGNTQTYLTAPTENGQGFVVIGADGQARVEDEPALTLPALTAVGDTQPSWKSLMVATGSNPMTWKQVPAPASGTYQVLVANGSYTLSDAGTLPGLNQVGALGTVPKADIIGILPGSDPGEFVSRRIAVTHGRVLVGDVDEDGVSGYKALASTAFLEHPKAAFPMFRFNTLEWVDGGGVVDPDGIPQAATSGPGAISDGELMVYSSDTKRAYRAPARALYQNNVSTNVVSASIGSSYDDIPGGHGAGAPRVYNYPDVVIAFNAGMAGIVSGVKVSFAIVRDGAVIHESDNDKNENVSFVYVDTGVAVGTHTYEIHWKRTAGSDPFDIRNSNFVVFALR